MSTSTKYHFYFVPKDERLSDKYSQAVAFRLRIMVGGEPQYFGFTEEEALELQRDVTFAQNTKKV